MRLQTDGAGCVAPEPKPSSRRGKPHHSAGSGLFPSGKPKIVVERHGFFTDPVVQRGCITRGGNDEGFKGHRKHRDFEYWRWDRNGAKRPAVCDKKSGR